MSLFGKQDERPPSHVAGEGTYGIGDLIRLLKIIPTTDHHSQLIVQVIKTTLESVGVKSSFVIDDALAQEKEIRDAMEMLESQIVVLGQEIDARRDQIAQLDFALRETIGAKNLLASAEIPPEALPEIDLTQARLVETSDPALLDRSLPPPLPPPRRKAAFGHLERAQDS
jgi:hypothetical protein